MAAERPLLAALGALVAIGGALPGDDVEWRRDALAQGELWRLWTGQFCHWSPLHLAGNLAALAALAVVIGRPARRWLAALPVAAPLLSLFLLLAAPTLERYRGLSGLLGVLIVGAALEGGTPGRLIAVAYVAKLAFDAAGGAASTLLPDGIAVARAAHLGGLLIGMALAGAFRLSRATTR